MNEGVVAKDELLKPEEVATQLRVSLATVNKWMNHGVRGVKLAAIKAGGLWRIRQSAVNAFVEASSPTPAASASETAAQSQADRELDRIGV